MFDRLAEMSNRTKLALLVSFIAILAVIGISIYRYRQTVTDSMIAKSQEVAESQEAAEEATLTATTAPLAAATIASTPTPILAPKSPLVTVTPIAVADSPLLSGPIATASPIAKASSDAQVEATSMATEIVLLRIQNAESAASVAESSSAAAEPNAELVYNLYLPVIMVQSIVGQIPAYDTSLVFNVDQNPTVTRLISLEESGGKSGNTLSCGENARLEVHVFGAEGEAMRLNNVIVQVVHTDENGGQRKKLGWTGAEKSERGVVSFALQHDAEVQIITDVDGHEVSSASMKVSTDPGKIPFGFLQTGGYCFDSKSCSELAQADLCRGKYSWNVVFKRSY